MVEGIEGVVMALLETDQYMSRNTRCVQWYAEGFRRMHKMGLVCPISMPLNPCTETWQQNRRKPHSAEIRTTRQKGTYNTKMSIVQGRTNDEQTDHVTQKLASLASQGDVV